MNQIIPFCSIKRQFLKKVNQNPFIRFQFKFEFTSTLDIELSYLINPSS